MKTGILYISFLFLLGCRQENPRVCRVVVNLTWGNLDSAILRKISLEGGPSKKISSQPLVLFKDSAVFELPISSDSLYQVSLKFSASKILFIPDCPYISIIMNAKTGKNSINGSPVSTALFRFNEEQDSLIALYRGHQTDWSDFKVADKKQQADSMQKLMTGLNSDIQQRYINFCDTVSNAIAFMISYDRIDFQNDFGRMKTLITKASERFPNSIPIQKSKQEVLNLVHIHEAELNVGDQFPVLSLPKLDGLLYSTDSARGKFVYIDFWSSWCQKCLAYNKPIKELLKREKFKDLILIHVAMDDQLETCRKMVAMQESPGIQLIDKDMWQGQTSSKLAFDSIPFNYLLGPDQRILTKAVPADSMSAVLQRFIH